MYYVYVLENAQGKLYCGQTESLERRVEQHNDPLAAKSKYTAKHGPWKLVWSEEHSDRSSAMLREKKIKAMKSAKWIREHLLDRNPAG